MFSVGQERARESAGADFVLPLNATVYLALTLSGVLGPLEVIAPSSSFTGVPHVLSGDCLSSHGHLFLSGTIHLLSRHVCHLPLVSPLLIVILAKLKWIRLNQIPR